MKNQSMSVERKDASVLQSFFTQVYGWMFMGLLTTGLVSYYTANSPALFKLVFGNDLFFYFLLFANLAIVFGLSAKINSLSLATASFFFMLYATLNGLLLAVIFLVYTSESIATTFFITAGMFGSLSAYGYFTKSDLSGMGSVLFMGLIGLIIASIVNLFLQSSALMWLTTYIGVFIFAGLTAYDTQKLKKIAQQIGDEESVNKIALLGALSLYLDFVNLFLHLLRIFGKKRR